MVTEIKINCSYIENYPVQNFNEYKDMASAVFAIDWCMTATFVHRIFTKEDLEEFLFRLPIALHSTGVLENWLLKGYLLKYKFKGRYHVLTLDDIIAHFGIEIYDVPQNFYNRPFYLDNVVRGLEFASVHSEVHGIDIISFKKEGNREKMVLYEETIPEITTKLIGQADFFVKDFMKHVPEEVFKNRSKTLVKKEKELFDRKEIIKTLPKFDVEKIPKDIIKQCIEIMYELEYAKKVLHEPEEFAASGKPLIFLAWLYANDFMESDGIMAFSKEGFYIDQDDFEGGSVYPIESIESHNIKEMLPLLKGLFINN